MLKYFVCPDKVIRPITQCLDKCPMPTGRCLALGHLHYIASSSRDYTGINSVTQLIKPTRLAWLEIVKDYWIDPDSMAFMMYGTLHHRRLESINKRLEGLTEYNLTQSISGTLDRLEPDELNPGYYKLIDFKLVGAYSVAKAIGLMKINGETADPDAIEWELQLNRYRILVESDPIISKLFPISRLLIQATVRDSGLRQINELKLPRRMPLIPIKKLPDDEVLEFFADKDYQLDHYLKNSEMPPMCNATENWNFRRCKSYCSLMPFCPEGARINKVELQN